MRTEFITSAAKASGFPALGLPEVAFIGRSNVGKSSLLNALVAAKIARTSRTPGRTQLVNFFSVEGRDGRYALADLPGYGFAQAPKSVRAAWAPLIEGYLSGRKPLKVALLLMDLRRDVEEDDLELLAWLKLHLEARGGKVLIVGTKADKLSKAHRKPALQKLAQGLGRPIGDCFLASTEDPALLRTLRDRLEALLLSSETATY